MSAPPSVTYFDPYSFSEIQDGFKLQVLAEINEDILHSSCWINARYFKFLLSKKGIFEISKGSIADCDGFYHYAGKTLPAQMLYEHEIFSTYFEGQEVQKWFTHRSNRRLVTVIHLLRIVGFVG